MRLRKTFLGCAIMAALMGVTSCSSYKSALYMQEAEQFNENPKSQLYDFRIMPKDELVIVVSTTDPEASAPFVRRILDRVRNLVVQHTVFRMLTC